MRTVPIVVAILIALAGCAPKAANPGEAKGGPDGTPAPTVHSVPAELQTDAHDYYGLGNRQTLTYEIVLGKGMAPQEGTQTTTPTGDAKDGKMTFETRRTGGLAQLGDETLSLQSDGLYLVAGSKVSPTKPALALPASLEVGKSWTDDTEMSGPGSSITLKGVSKVEGKESVTVKAGTFETLLVVQTAETVTNGSKGKVSQKTWFAKGIGVVKLNFELKQENGEILTTTLELVKQGGEDKSEGQ